MRGLANPHHFRIGKRPVIGQVGIKRDVIEHAGHGHRHAGHHMARVPSAAAFQLRQDFLRIAKGEIMEQHNMLLPVKQGLRRFTHNQGGCQKLLLLQSKMGMHPVGAGTRVHKIIVMGLAGFQWCLRQHGNAVLGGGRVQSVPVQKCFNIQFVFDPRLEPLPQHQRKPVSAATVYNAENLRGAAVNLNDP